MEFSKLKIPRICEQCSKAFEAKTMTTRFCSLACANKSGKEKHRLLYWQNEESIFSSVISSPSDKFLAFSA